MYRDAVSVAPALPLPGPRLSSVRGVGSQPAPASAGEAT